MLSNIHWFSFFGGALFAMFVWPWIMGLFTRMTASATTKAQS